MRKVAIFALSLLGLFDSIYLLWVYTSPAHPMVCLGTGCDAVRASSYAHAWGVPLPVFGVLMYAALALLVFFGAWLGRASEGPTAFISGAGVLTSLYLTGLEAFVIRAWCAWCVVSALTVTAIFVLAIWDLAVRPTRGVTGAPGVQQPRRLNPQFLVVFLVAVAAGVPAFIYLSHHGEVGPVKPPPNQALAQYLVRPDSHATGDLQSPVRVVEFGDFECPACRAAQPVVDAMRQKYGDRIRFVFRQFPLQAVHPQAEKAAEASECAAEQGKFWQMQDKLYRGTAGLKQQDLLKAAADLGLNRKEFSRCLDTGAMAARVQQDVSDAHALGLRGTPTFVIGRQIVFGPVTLGQFATLIDQQLAIQPALTARVKPAPSDQGKKRGQGSGGSQMAGAATKSDVRPGSSSESSNSSTSSSGALGNGSNPFSSLGAGSELACSEDEASKRQPALVHTDEARRLFTGSSRALFVDVRPPGQYAGGHIRGAVNLPVEDIPQRWNTLPKTESIVLYESGKGSGDNICAAARAAGRILLEHGFAFERVKVYQDGLSAWQNAGLPLGS